MRFDRFTKSFALATVFVLCLVAITKPPTPTAIENARSALGQAVYEHGEFTPDLETVRDGFLPELEAYIAFEIGLLSKVAEKRENSCYDSEVVKTIFEIKNMSFGENQVVNEIYLNDRLYILQLHLNELAECAYDGIRQS